MRWGRARTRAAEAAGPSESSSQGATPSKSLAFKLALLAVAPFVLLSTVLLLGVTYQFERLSEMTIGKQEMEFSTPVVKEIEAAVRKQYASEPLLTRDLTKAQVDARIAASTELVMMDLDAGR